jgi:hypothetical protein
MFNRLSTEFRQIFKPIGLNMCGEAMNCLL